MVQDRAGPAATHAAATPSARGAATRGGGSGQRPAVALAALVVVVALVVWEATGFGTAYVRTAVTWTAFSVTVVLAGVACAGTAWRRDGEARLGWALLAAAMASLAVVELFAFSDEVVLDRPAAVWSEIGDVGAVPFALAAVLVLANGFLGAVERARVAIDGAIIAVAVLYLTWEQILEPIYRGAGLAGTERRLDLINSVGDVIVVGAVVALTFRGRPGGRLPLALVAGGLAALAGGNFAVPYLEAEGDLSSGTVFDGITVAGYLLIALAALAARRSLPARAGGSEPVRRTATPRRVAVELLPYPVALAALTAGIVHGFRDADGRYVALLVILGVTLLALVTARASLTIIANGRLTRSLARHASALERLSRQQESVLNSAGDGIYGIDSAGRITFVNPAALRLLGAEPAELVGQPHDVLLAPTGGNGDSAPSARPDGPLTVALDGGGPHTAAATYRRADATVFPAEHTATAIRQDGHAAGAVVVFRDITERRAVEKMRNEFISVVSHELRTPLTSVRGALGLLAGGALGGLPERAQRMADVAVDSTDRLIRLINDILDVERMAAGKLVLKRRRCTAVELVSPAVEAMGPYAADAGVTLRTEIGDGGEVWADPDRINQTLTNLIGNAVKFSPPAGTVTIRTVVDDAAVRFQVADEGRGIPPDQLEKVFGRFQQVDASDSRQKGGTGLGLAICRGIVEQHGGRIWVDSEPGKGSTFTFELSSVGPRAVQPAGAPSVFLCDDDPGLLEVMGTALETQGYRVTTTTSGAEVVERAAADPPDVIVLDLLMPEMNGWQTAAALRNQPATASVPVVIMSALTPPETAGAAGATSGRTSGRTSGVASGADDWVPKGLGPGGLVAALERILDHHDRPGRVLVVEDDEGLGQVLVEMFTGHGLDAVLAITGAQAVELSRRLHPQLLILDLDLPELDGFGVVERLRQDDDLRSVPVVVYTALELTDSDRRRLQLGETHFMTKSRTAPEEFERRVVGLLNRITTADDDNHVTTAPGEPASDSTPSGP